MRTAKRESRAVLRAPTPVVGSGGGVGTTTLCRWLGDLANDHATRTPEWTGTPIVVTCRTTAESVMSASRLIGSLTSSALAVRIVLAAVGDGPSPEPGLVRARLRALAAHTTGVVRLPYVEAWRYVDDPLSRPVPPTYERALRALVRLVNRT